MLIFKTFFYFILYLRNFATTYVQFCLNFSFCFQSFYFMDVAILVILATTPLEILGNLKKWGGGEVDFSIIKRIKKNKDDNIHKAKLWSLFVEKLLNTE